MNHLIKLSIKKKIIFSIFKNLVVGSWAIIHKVSTIDKIQDNNISTRYCPKCGPEKVAPSTII